MIYLGSYRSPLGAMTMASDGEALTGLWFDGQKYDRIFLKNREWKQEEIPLFHRVREWLDQYFSGVEPTFRLPIKVEGSIFKKTVADIMCEIPFGKTTTYKAIAVEAAKRLGKERMSAQAVGGAVGHNAISIVIPCHRVVGTNGSLTGYAGGLEKKMYLLENEGVHLASDLSQIFAEGLYGII